jgi:hypothetical protein
MIGGEAGRGCLEEGERSTSPKFIGRWRHCIYQVSRDRFSIFFSCRIITALSVCVVCMTVTARVTLTQTFTQTLCETHTRFCLRRLLGRTMKRRLCTAVLIPALEYRKRHRSPRVTCICQLSICGPGLYVFAASTKTSSSQYI